MKIAYSLVFYALLVSCKTRQFDNNPKNSSDFNSLQENSEETLIDNEGKLPRWNR